MADTLRLPDWISKDQTLMLLSGQELVAYKEPKGEWKVKKERCNHCGECCFDIPDSHTPFGSDEEGKCNMLEEENGKWLCRAGWKKPFCCLSDPTENDINELGCSIRYN